MRAPDPVAGRRLKPIRPKVKSPAQPKPVRPAPSPKPSLLDAQTQAAANMAYGGAEQELAGQRATSGQMMRNIPAWFADYQNALSNATDRTQRAYSAALGFQQNAAASSSALDEQQRAALAGSMQADAQQRGATVDPGVAGEAQQAATSRRAMLDSFSGLTAGLGAAETAFSAGREGVGAGQKLSALTGEAQRGRNLDAKATDLAREKGDYAVGAREKLIQARHTRSLERKAFGLDVEKAQQDAVADAAAAEDRRRARTTSNRNADDDRAQRDARASETARHNREMEANARARRAAQGARTDHVAQRDARKLGNNINTAAADARTLRGASIPVEDAEGKPTGKTRKLTESEIRANLRKRYKDADVANAAMDLAVLGYVSATNERRLRARGIPVPSRWVQRRPSRPAIIDVAAGRPSMSATPPK